MGTVGSTVTHSLFLFLSLVSNCGRPPFQRLHPLSFPNESAVDSRSRCGSLLLLRTEYTGFLTGEQGGCVIVEEWGRGTKNPGNGNEWNYDAIRMHAKEIATRNDEPYGVLPHCQQSGHFVSLPAAGEEWARRSFCFFFSFFSSSLRSCSFPSGFRPFSRGLCLAIRPVCPFWSKEAWGNE